MKVLLLTPPDARRWALQSTLLNAGYEVKVYEEPREAALAFGKSPFELVVIHEPGDGTKFTGRLLQGIRASGPAHPPILCISELPARVQEGLGDMTEMVCMVPGPVDALILRCVFEDLGLPWGQAPASRPSLAPPTPERPWGLEGMKAGTVDAAGEVVEAAEPAAEAEEDEAPSDEGATSDP